MKKQGKIINHRTSQAYGLEKRKRTYKMEKDRTGHSEDMKNKEHKKRRDKHWTWKTGQTKDETIIGQHKKNTRQILDKESID